MQIKPALPLIAVFLTLSSWAAAAQSGSFQLKIFQGFRFSDGATVESGKGADLSFYYQTRRMAIISYLGADKIKRFDAAPDPRSLTAAEVGSWNDYIPAPSPGYYVIRTKDGKYYLVNLQKFENQGKAASSWLMSFNWEEIAVR